MTKKYLLYIYMLLLNGVFINACNGQLLINSPKETSHLKKTSPLVIGTPPPLFPSHNPYNDFGLVSQYIRTIFQDSKGNFWFGPSGQSVARYDEKTLKYYSRKEFFHGNNSADPQAFTVFTKEDGLNCCVQSMYQDRSGNMWWGTGQGLYRFDGKGFYQVQQNGPW